MEKKNVFDILDRIFKGSNIAYKVVDKDIILTVAPQQSGKRITGKVVDESGEPVIGASVTENGTTNGTVTDSDGNFTLTVAENATLQISYVGYKPFEISALSGGGG
jgi:hypothetical protein